MCNDTSPGCGMIRGARIDNSNDAGIQGVVQTRIVSRILLRVGEHAFGQACAFIDSLSQPPGARSISVRTSLYLRM